MNEAKYLVKKITEGIQEKKGKNIVMQDFAMTARLYWIMRMPDWSTASSARKSLLARNAPSIVISRRCVNGYVKLCAMPDLA